MIDLFYEWFFTLPYTLRVYWVIALITSLFFLIQMVMTFIGIGDADSGADFGGDADFGADGNTMDVGGAMQLFTIRNFVNFLLGLGWGGVCFYSLIPNTVLLSVVAVLSGVFFVYVFLLLYKQVMRLEQNGAFRVEDSIGSVVDVYLSIPPRRCGSGKVQISFDGSVQEILAQTDSEELIRSGSKVRVLEVIGGMTVLVEKV